MKCTKIVLSGLVAFTATANAMPTQEETKKAEPLVMGLMRADQAALKSGKKTRAEVAESAIKLADKAESEAEKLLLMKGAFNLYVRAGDRNAPGHAGGHPRHAAAKCQEHNQYGASRDPK